MQHTSPACCIVQLAGVARVHRHAVDGVVEGVLAEQAPAVTTVIRVHEAAIALQRTCNA
jgi:hypothetical protein